MESATTTRKQPASALAEAAEAPRAGATDVHADSEIDGFHLLIDALVSLPFCCAD